MPMVMMTMLTNKDLQGPLEVPRDKLEKERQKAKKKAGLMELFLPFLCLFLTCLANGKKVKILLKSCSILSS